MIPKILPPRAAIRWRKTLRILREIKAESILEIGFGNGYILNHLAQNTEVALYGKEKSESAINNIAMTSLATRLKIVSDISEYVYDLVLMFEVLGYVEDIEMLLKSINKSLSKGGFLIVSITNSSSIGRAENVTNMKGFTDDEISKYYLRADFSLVKSIAYGGPILRLIHNLRGHVQNQGISGSDYSSIEESWRYPGNAKVLQYVFWIFAPIFELIDLLGRKSKKSGRILVLRKST